jgi:hypothetical protein
MPSPKKFDKFYAQEVRFLGEQNGTPEHLLKNKLAEFFQRDGSVSRSYLARIDYEEGKNTVVLGLRTQFGPDRGMVEKVGAIFAVIFNSKEHLDIMFLTDSEEAELARVCKPFFRQDEDRNGNE